MVLGMGQYYIDIKDITVSGTGGFYIYAVLSQKVLDMLGISIEDIPTARLTGIAFTCYHYEKTCFLLANMVYDFIRKTPSIKEGIIYKVIDYYGMRFFSIFNNVKLVRVSMYYGVRLSPGIAIDPRELLVTNRMLFTAMKSSGDGFVQLEYLAKEVIKYIIDHMR